MRLLNRNQIVVRAGTIGQHVVCCGNARLMLHELLLSVVHACQAH